MKGYTAPVIDSRLRRAVDASHLERNGEGSNGEDANGEGSNGEGSSGEGSNGEGSNGEGSNDEGSNGEGSHHAGGYAGRTVGYGPDVGMTSVAEPSRHHQLCCEGHRQRRVLGRRHRKQNRACVPRLFVHICRGSIT